MSTKKIVKAVKTALSSSNPKHDDTATGSSSLAGNKRQAEDVPKAIKKVNDEIDEVNHQIKEIEKKLENPMETWTEMVKVGKHLGFKDAGDWVKELRDDKNKLLDKEKQMRDTLNKLLDEKKQLRDKEMIPATKRLSDEDAVTFTVRRSSRFYPTAYFEYVADPRLPDLVQHVKNLQNENAKTFFKYPVIDGGTGVGKTRLGLEVMGECKTDTLCLFVNLNQMKNVQYSDERGGSADRCVADLIFQRLVPNSVWSESEYRYTLEEVLDKVARDLGKFSIILQIDEYAANFPIVRAVIRKCEDLYRAPHRFEDSTAMRVIPILTGIPIVGARKEMLEVSNKAQPMFVTLSGVADVKQLKANFCKELSIKKKVRYLEIILDTFGGVPRLYDDLRALLVDDEVLSAKLRTGKLDLEDAKRLYNTVKEKHLQQYGLTIWENYFSKSPDRVRVARGALRRIHTLAITGQTTNELDCVVKGHPATFDELSSLGLFTYVVDPLIHTEGTISVPLLTVDAYIQLTGICPPAVLSPFAYAWESMEYVAMLSLVCRWNSIWFANGEKPKEVPLSQLRPGAYTKPGGFGSKTVEVNCELPQLVQLAMGLSGDHTTEFPTNADGRGDKKKITDRSVYLLTPGQAGNDGLAVFTPYMWLNQTKSADLICANKEDNPPSTITQGAVDELVKRQHKHLAFSFHGATDVVYDIFTNRTRGTNLDDKQLPYNTFLTTRENFAEVVGPVFAHTIDLITWNMKKKRVDRKARTSGVV